MDDKWKTRVADIARRRGIIIKFHSETFISKKVAENYLHGSLDMISDGEIFTNITKLLAQFPTQFGDPSPLARKSAEQRLDEENAKAATRAEQTPPAIPGKIDRASMSEKERAAFDKLTVEQKLSFANDKAAEFLAKKKAQKS